MEITFLSEARLSFAKLPVVYITSPTSQDLQLLIFLNVPSDRRRTE